MAALAVAVAEKRKRQAQLSYRLLIMKLSANNGTAEITKSLFLSICYHQRYQHGGHENL
jgi:hypothetical protein